MLYWGPAATTASDGTAQSVHRARCPPTTITPKFWNRNVLSFSSWYIQHSSNRKWACFQTCTDVVSLTANDQSQDGQQRYIVSVYNIYSILWKNTKIKVWYILSFFFRFCFVLLWILLLDWPDNERESSMWLLLIRKQKAVDLHSTQGSQLPLRE